MSNDAKRPTASGLMEFLAYVKEKGLMAGRTAEAYKSATTRILQIDGENWEDTDLRSIDLDMQMDRFVRLQGTKFKPETLQTYKGRFRSAVAEYLRYQNDPMTYRGPISQRPERQRKPAPAASKSHPDAAAGTAREPAERYRQTEEPGGGRPSLVKYPFPLRSGQMAYLELPRDLSRVEAQRMAAFIASLAIDDGPELPPLGGPET